MGQRLLNAPSLLPREGIHVQLARRPQGRELAGRLRSHLRIGFRQQEITGGRGRLGNGDIERRDNGRGVGKRLGVSEFVVTGDMPDVAGRARSEELLASMQVEN